MSKGWYEEENWKWRTTPLPTPAMRREERPTPPTRSSAATARDRHSTHPHLSHDRVRRIDPVLRLLARRDVDDLPGDPPL